MENFGSTVDRGIAKPKKRQKWMYSVNNYNSAMVTLRQKTSYSADQILTFQLMIDHAYLVLRSMYGLNIVMSYFQLLSSQHIAWLMESLLDP
jgi:hypothetical protein